MDGAEKTRRKKPEFSAESLEIRVESLELRV
jgi:hypothetical protein